MNKIRLLRIFMLIITLSCLLLSGCSKEERISSISLKDQDPSTAIEMQIGAFDYAAHTLVVSYDSGNTTEIALTEDMFLATDVFKFYQEGEHEVTLSYEDVRHTFRISVKRGILGEVKFPENNVFTYDGNAHTVEIEGEIPANAVVTYPGGNSFVNAGVYDVTATVTCEGYVTKKLSTTVTVEPAKHNMEDVRFDPKEVVYDGNSHSVMISGTLPEGVSRPTYYINDNKTSSATNAGEYTVFAVFSNNDPNYEAIPDMQTTLKILPADYAMPDIGIVFENEDGSVAQTTKTYDGTEVTFDISDKVLLSKKVKVTFSVINSSGEVISTSNTETNMKNVGSYTVKVEFSLADHKNYNPIDPLICDFEITKAEYDMSGVYFDSDLLEYDGLSHKLQVTLPPQFAVEAEDVTYEYYFGDQLLADAAEAGVTDAGEYTVKAMFAVKDENYMPIPDMQAKLIIEKKKIDLSDFGFGDQTILNYNGENQTVAFNGMSAENVTFSTVIYKITDENQTVVSESKEVGKYRCEITVSVKSSNYVLSSGSTSNKFTCDYEIVSAD